MFLYDTDVLLGTLEKLSRNDEGLADYGHGLVPHMAEHETVAEHRLTGYWRDVGTLQSYWEAHMDLLAGRGVELENPAWPILTSSPQRLPAFVARGAEVENSLLAPGARVSRRVVGSVVGPGAVIEAGATVTDSVLLGGVRVAAGAALMRVVADTGTEVGAGRTGNGEVTPLGGS